MYAAIPDEHYIKNARKDFCPFCLKQSIEKMVCNIFV